jgi:hypothetical protein
MGHPEIRIICPYCQREVKVAEAALGQISQAMRFRLDNIGTQVECTSCRQTFVHRAPAPPAPNQIPGHALRAR